jgi:hypothetical protein
MCQLFTVFSLEWESGQIPREVNLVNGQAEALANQVGNGKHVRICGVPGWDEGFNSYCFQFIGQGDLSVLLRTV